MKEVLIVFIVLLILLLLLSTLGGSIRINENYEDDIPLYEESLLSSRQKPWELNPQYVHQETAREIPRRVRQEEAVSRRMSQLRPVKQEAKRQEEEMVYPFDGDEAFAAV